MENYLKLKQERENLLPKFRDLCSACLQPGFSCYCSHVQKFDPKIEFVILIHPIEVRRRIATGRMSHLCLEGSSLIHGQDYSNNLQVNQRIQNPNNQCFILYPHIQSKNLSSLSVAEKSQLINPSKKTVLFIIDGTWATAKKMLHQSQNLHQLPKLCFSPQKPSTFRVRKQPAEGCYSTIEAIHQVIDLIGDQCGFNTKSKEHDKLLFVFDKMVERQLYFIEQSNLNPKSYYYSRKRSRQREKKSS